MQGALPYPRPMRALLDHVAASLVANGLVPADGRILVAVSGGVDSQMLLQVLHRLAGPMSLTLTVAHANHQLRGRSADADARLVENGARMLGWKWVTECLPVAAEHARSEESIEMTARRLRHAFLAHLARQRGISTIALGHHADDQAELVLMRLLRGAGGDGLGGMAHQNPSPADARVRLIRPFLDLPKSRLISAARDEGIRFREDRTNRDRKILRNRIRYDLLPMLERRFNPSLRAQLARSADLVGEDARYVADQARRWISAARQAPFSSLHTALQRSVLREEIRALGFEPGFDLIERLRLRTDTPEQIEPGLRIQRTVDGRIVRTVPAPQEAFRSDESLHRLQPGGGTIETGGRRIEYRMRRVRGGPPSPVRSVPNEESFSARAVGTRVILRHWRPGDRFQPLGFTGDSKLQDIFINRKVPASRRRGLLVATTAAGIIFWVESLPPGERFKLRGSTRGILVWKWRPAT